MEPLAEIDQLGIALSLDIFVVQGVTVDAEQFELAMRRIHQGTAGCFIDTARLHANQAVFNQIDNTDPVGAADFVQALQKLDRSQRYAVDFDRDAFFKFDFDISRLVRGVFRGDTQFENLLILRFIGRAFEVHALMAQVPEVLVHRIIIGLGDRNRDAAFVGIIDLFIA